MTDTPNTTTFGHVALHYGKPEDGPLTAKLFKLMGFVTREEIAYPDGTVFYHFLVDPHATNKGDGILYLAPLKDVPRALYEAIRSTFRADQPDEDKVVSDYRAAARENPEFGFHVGFLKSSLEELEEIVQRVQHAVETDPDFKGRVEVILNRAKPGTPEIDARMDASPVFRDVTRHTFGRNGVQAFVKTNLLAGPPLGDAVVIEFDYVFPEYETNMLTKSFD
ncbi:hypothetical protein [Paracoccus sp. 22332]|uniref:hypothetical protein n=1 Tax=Paracoccus sp. 22332 TaxID=3453913 RepID=UPI003F868BB0